ncbi:MAG: histidine phosphatase family protein [Bryobacteraceae bacterium]
MSDLTLVRHGQARSFQADPDHLTEMGFAQAKRLGEVWAEAGVTFDEVHSGSLRRHRQTEETVAAVYAKLGKPWPHAIVNPDWNEYDAEGVMRELRPALAASDERFRVLGEDAARHHGTPEQNRYFQRMFEVLMQAWLEGAVLVDGAEPFAAFHGRVNRAVDQLMASSGNKRVAVFSSGGPVGVCVQRAVRAPDRAFLDVNWRVRNCSLSQWVYSRDRFTLDAFNSVAHLPAKLVTYR